MNYINTRRDELGIFLKYSTLTEYFESIASLDFTTFTSDFYPYATNIEGFFSGFFTSRASFKDLARIVEQRARTGETLFSISRANGRVEFDNNYDKVMTMRRSEGIILHHDGNDFL